ncbi:hypothetical protein T07_4707 [Trichinella nelsoni]|uniref:Uncharacterized protein n=1 Tax=Trichinella nelsoni TaxID=6336 RepID=A0A0V0S6A6_9BILA|nr:hypothetical protein T07_4707 [Trichinella nelsoni]
MEYPLNVASSASKQQKVINTILLAIRYETLKNDCLCSKWNFYCMPLQKQLPLRTNGYKPRIAFNPLLQTIILFSVGDWCTKYPSSLSKAGDHDRSISIKSGLNNSGLQLNFCTFQVSLLFCICESSISKIISCIVSLNQ